MRARRAALRGAGSRRSMFVVTVEFEVRRPFADAFLAAVRTNAMLSRRGEPGCRQFDVCVAPDDASRLFLYEIYDDPDAFAVHVRTEHFAQFDAEVRDWVERKVVRTYHRLFPEPTPGVARMKA
jgi:quinol monooxygenase YgiN